MNNLRLTVESIRHITGKGTVASVSLADNGITLAHLYNGRTVEAEGKAWVVKGVEFAQLTSRVADKVGLIIAPA